MRSCSAVTPLHSVVGGRQDTAEVLKPAVLQRLDRPDFPLCELCDLFQREVGHEPEKDDLALVGGQRLQCGHERGVDRLGRRRRGLVVGRPVDHVRAAGRPPTSVEHSVVRDGEDPAAQGGGVAREAVDVAGDLEEDLAEQILGVADALRAQIGQDVRGQRPVGVASSERQRRSPSGT